MKKIPKKARAKRIFLLMRNVELRNALGAQLSRDFQFEVISASDPFELSTFSFAPQDVILREVELIQTSGKKGNRIK